MHKATFTSVNMQKSKIYSANLEDANFRGVDMREAVFGSVILINADFRLANLQGTHFSTIDIRSADFSYAIIDGGTTFIDGIMNDIFIISDNMIEAYDEGTKNQKISAYIGVNEWTNFTGTALDSARMPPEANTLLKKNIRRLSWERWYAEKLAPKKLDSQQDNAQVVGKPKDVLMVSIVKLFWRISDYGTNTGRIFWFLCLMAAIFSVPYAYFSYVTIEIFPALRPPHHWRKTSYDFFRWLLWITTIFCFAIASMVTLGFALSNVQRSVRHPILSTWAMLLVVFNLMTGYFILACLVTRIGIIFQNFGP